MPELPEVENVVLSLRDRIIGKRIIQVILINKKIIKKPSIAEDFESNMLEQTFRSLTRRGKYIIAEMESGDRFICHLGMTGLLFHKALDATKPERYSNHTQCSMLLNDGTILYYFDIRKFGSLRILTANEYLVFAPIQLLGPDASHFYERKGFIGSLTTKSIQKKSIKESLMDQTIVSGIGNIYASEILYAVGIDPRSKVKDLTAIDRNRIFDMSITILQDSIAKGGTSISDYINGTGKPGTFQNYLRVYKKKHCLICGGAITAVKIAERNTFYCPSCQKLS